jgi:hypothetical protein
MVGYRPNKTNTHAHTQYTQTLGRFAQKRFDQKPDQYWYINTRDHGRLGLDSNRSQVSLLMRNVRQRSRVIVPMLRCIDRVNGVRRAYKKKKVSLLSTDLAHGRLLLCGRHHGVIIPL